MEPFQQVSDRCCKLLLSLFPFSAYVLLGINLMKLLFHLPNLFVCLMTGQQSLGSLETYGASCPMHLDWQSRCAEVVEADGLADLG